MFFILLLIMVTAALVTIMLVVAKNDAWDFDDDAMGWTVMSSIMGVILVVLLACVWGNNSAWNLAENTATYEELVRQVKYAEINPVTQDEAYYLRRNCREFNEDIIYAQRMHKNFFVGVFVDKGMENFELIDYGKIKFSRNYLITGVKELVQEE